LETTVWCENPLFLIDEIDEMFFVASNTCKMSSNPHHRWDFQCDDKNVFDRNMREIFSEHTYRMCHGTKGLKPFGHFSVVSILFLQDQYLYQWIGLRKNVGSIYVTVIDFFFP
jgi:hypothetical protein